MPNNAKLDALVAEVNDLRVKVTELTEMLQAMQAERDELRHSYRTLYNRRMRDPDIHHPG